MKADRKDILVPVDFGENTKNVLKYACKIQDKLKGKLHLLHVVFKESWWAKSVLTDEVTHYAKEKLQRYVKRYDLNEDTIIQVKTGKRHKAILEYASSINPAFIILSDKYPSNKGVKKLGSTLSQIIISSKFPVIVTKSETKTVFKNVLLPLDLMQDCQLKLRNSISIALNFNSKIHLASVLFGNSRVNWKKINEKLEDYKNNYLERGIGYSVQLLQKRKEMAYKEILSIAEEKEYDAILIMTHNEKGIDNYLGAFAQHIINESTIPVISITKQAAKEKYGNFFKAVMDPLGVIKY